MADKKWTAQKRGRPPNTPRREKNPYQKKINFLNNIQLPTSNRFSALSSENATQSDKTQQQNKKTSVSPIVVTEHESDIQAIIKELGLNCNLKLNSVGRKIFPATIADKDKIIKKLKEKKIDFFSHPETNAKAFKVILSGLPEIDTKDIKESLAEHQITPSKIVMFNTQSKNKLYLLHFDAEKVNKKKLDTIKYVYHHVISWLPYKPKRNGPTQCMRCLMYGHGISSCFRYAVCMVCAGSHLTKEHDANADIADNTNTEFKCFNCLSAKLPHNHKANDAACPFRLKYENARNNARNKTTTQRTQSNQNAHTQNHRPTQTQTKKPSRPSYADTARTATASTSHAQFDTTTNSRKQSEAHSNTRFNDTSSHTNRNANTNNLWTIDECANLLFDSIEKLQKCNSKLEQLKVITNLLKHACT